MAATSVAAFTVPKSGKQPQQLDAASSRRDVLQKSLATFGSLALLGAPSVQAATVPTVGGKIKYGDESIMRPKAHGTSEQAVQEDLLYGVSWKLADKICNFNR